MDIEQHKNHSKNGYYKITLTVSMDLDELLVKTGNDARAHKGNKLPKTLIVRALIRLLKEVDVDLDHVKTEEQFYSRLKAALLKEKNK